MMMMMMMMMMMTMFIRGDQSWGRVWWCNQKAVNDYTLNRLQQHQQTIYDEEQSLGPDSDQSVQYKGG